MTLHSEMKEDGDGGRQQNKEKADLFDKMADVEVLIGADCLDDKALEKLKVSPMPHAAMTHIFNLSNLDFYDI